MNDLAKSVQGTSLSFDIGEIQPRLVISFEGMDKTGKTHLAFTAPGPIGYFSTDFGDEGVIQKFTGNGKVIARAKYSYDIPVFTRSKSVEEDRKRWAAKAEEYRREVWDRFVADYSKAIEVGFRTIIWDTASEFNELQRLANFGKLEQNPQLNYGPLNAEFKNLIRKAVESPRTNLILIHHVKERYEVYLDAQGREKSRPTGKYERSGNSHIGKLVQAYVCCRYVDPKPKEGKDGRFEVEVLRSRHSPQTVGTVIESPDFATLASVLLPEVDPVEWE